MDAFSSGDLGRPFTKKLVPLGGDRLYRAKVEKNVPVGKVRTRFTVHSRAAAARGKVEAAVFFAAHASYAKEKTVGVYSIEYIKHCDRYETREFATPSKGRYFPVAVCYGMSWHYYFKSDSRSVGGGFEAEVSKMLSLGASAQAQFAKHGYTVEHDATGVSLREGCDNLLIESAADFNKCFSPDGPPAVVSVSWWEIERPGDTKKSRRKRKKRIAKAQERATACVGAGAQCLPCKVWEFDEVEYRPPKQGFEISITVSGPDGVTQTEESSSMLLDPPIRARPGQSLQVRVYDRDLFFDDLLLDDRVRIKARHESNTASKGRVSFRGQCLR